MTQLTKIQEEISLELADENVSKALLATTFKGLSLPSMKMAIQEGMIRGFNFKDFLEKNVYAIPYGQGYSLVSSVDYARKIGMRSGVVGKSAPKFEMDENGKPVSCTITVKRMVSGTVGEYTETVYLDEYSTGRNLWTTKPKTMLAKVAEMHALRMACPEELSQSYVEEEVQQEIAKPIIKLENYEDKLKATKTLDELKSIWSSLPGEAKKDLNDLKEELKTKFEKEVKVATKKTKNAN